MGHGVVSRRIADGVMDRLRFDNAAKERIGELVEWQITGWRRKRASAGC